MIDYFDYHYKLINPKIIGSSGIQECVEGCLSFPDCFVKTIRPQIVTVQAQDEMGQEIILSGEGEMAKCFCHELGHLDGIIFLDHAVEEIDLLK